MKVWGWLLSALAEQACDLGAEVRRDVVARERIGDVRRQESDLGAAVERAALELEPVERQGPGQADHGVGDLDVAAGAVLLGRQQGENLRVVGGAAGDEG